MPRPAARSAIALPLLVCLGLAGCAGQTPTAAPVAPSPAPTDAVAPASQATAPAPEAVEIVETVPEAVVSAGPAGGALGEVTVALGSPTDPGLWVKTDRVTADTPGTVQTGTGEALAVTLRPLDGDGGAQISLSALQALGLPLAGLHPVTLARAG